MIRRGEKETARIAIKWKTLGKQSRPMKRWVDVVEKYLKTLGIEDSREAVVQDRDK